MTNLGQLDSSQQKYFEEGPNHDSSGKIDWVVPLPRIPVTFPDCYVFSRGSQAKPSFGTVTGRDNPKYIHL